MPNALLLFYLKLLVKTNPRDHVSIVLTDRSIRFVLIINLNMKITSYIV